MESCVHGEIENYCQREKELTEVISILSSLGGFATTVDMIVLTPKGARLDNAAENRLKDVCLVATEMLGVSEC